MPSKPPTALWSLFTVFFSLGIQSFGGGTSTLFLIHQAAVQRGWMAEEEFIRAWALVQISPGINLIKLTILIGRRLRGWPGLVSACAGLLLPSAAVTVLMTAGFSAIREVPAVQSAMKGILPATIGLSLAMAYQMAYPLFTRAHREGPPRLWACTLLLAAAALLMASNAVSPVVVLLAGGASGLLLAFVPVRPAKGGRP